MHRETRIANYTLLAFSIVSLTLLSLPLSGPVQAFKACVKYVLSPAAYYGARGTQRLADIPPNIVALITAETENRLMREEVRRAAWWRAEAESLRIENERLRATMSLKPPTRSSPLWARVIERDPSHWYRSVVVDAGAEQGVEINAPVLGAAGPDKLAAIGRVVEVRQRSALVLLLTDELSSVAAQVTTTPAAPAVAPDGSTATVSGVAAAPRSYDGLLQGQGGPRLLMNYLPPEAVVAKGNLVMTSPTSATFPPDVLIGVVAEVRPLDTFLTFQSLEIKPAIEASALKELMILKNLGPVPSLSAGTASAAAEARP